MNKKFYIRVAIIAVSVLSIFNSNHSYAQSVLYYWSFNSGDSSVHTPDITNDTTGGSAYYDYYCAYTDYITGAAVNLQPGYAAGNCIRFRNPSDSVVFHMPTSHYKNIMFSYAEQKTTNGSVTNSVFISTDGVNFLPSSVADAADSSVYTVDSQDVTTGDTLQFQLKTFNFTGYAAASNCANFAIAIVFSDDTAVTGNDRFDNVTLSGTMIPTGVTNINAANETVNVFPNPAANNINIGFGTVADRTVIVYDILGQKVMESAANTKVVTLNIASLVNGTYVITTRNNESGEVRNSLFEKN